MTDKPRIIGLWAPNLGVRFFSLALGIAGVVLCTAFDLTAIATILIGLMSVITLCYGLYGIIRRPRMAISEHSLLIRRVFRDHIYPLYVVNGFRIDKQHIFSHTFSSFLTFDIARVEEWNHLKKQWENSFHDLPLPLPTMSNRERAILETLTVSDLGIMPHKIAQELVDAGLRDLSDLHKMPEVTEDHTGDVVNPGDEGKSNDTAG